MGWSFGLVFVNVGGEGQLLIGGIAGAGVALAVGDALPGGVTLALILVAGALGGALWAALSVMRSRAVPTGTVGGRMAGTHRPCASSADANARAAALSPTIRGWMAVADSVSCQPNPGCDEIRVVSCVRS